MPLSEHLREKCAENIFSSCTVQRTIRGVLDRMQEDFGRAAIYGFNENTGKKSWCFNELVTG